LVNDKKRWVSHLRFVFCPEPGRIEFNNLALKELQVLVPGLR
jgi:hypothetical protein